MIPSLLLFSSFSSSSSFFPTHPLQHENGEGSSALKSGALLYTILCSISGCGVREASCYN
jgi:hypothetical protein